MPDAAYLGQTLVNGLSVGCIYGLIGIGFCVIYNASGIVNFAQGMFVMLGGMICHTLLSRFGLPIWWTPLPSGSASGSILGRWNGHWPERRGPKAAADSESVEGDDVAGVLFREEPPPFRSPPLLPLRNGICKTPLRLATRALPRDRNRGARCSFHAGDAAAIPRVTP